MSSVPSQYLIHQQLHAIYFTACYLTFFFLNTLRKYLVVHMNAKMQHSRVSTHDEYFYHLINRPYFFQYIFESIYDYFPLCCMFQTCFRCTNKYVTRWSNFDEKNKVASWYRFVAIQYVRALVFMYPRF